MNSVPDFVQDKSAVLLVQIANRYSLPTYVKQAAFDELKKVDQVSLNAFADPLHKKFACHNPAATWLSAAYFFDNCNPDYYGYNKNIISKLEKFAAYFGIESDYKQLVKQAEAYHAETLPDQDYAYVWQSDSGEIQRSYPMTNAMEVKIAAEWLDNIQDRINYSDAHTIATKITSKADKYGADLGKHKYNIEKLAGLGIPDVQGIVHSLEQRAKIAPAELKGQILKLAQTIEQTPKIAIQQNQLVKLASTIDEIDYNLRIKGKYGEILKRPVDFIFALPLTKAAADLSNFCELQTGAIFEKAQLSKIAVEDLEAALGSDFVEQVTTGLDVDPEKIASIASTLPRGDAELLEGLLAEAGQHPQALNKQASFSVIPEQELEKIAAMYQR